MMNVLLASILGVLCALVGVLALGLIGWVVLELFGVSNRNHRALKLAVLIFGLPAGIAGFWIGYRMGSTLVPPEDQLQLQTAAVPASAAGADPLRIA